MICECHITCWVSQAKLAQSVADEDGWKTSEIHRDISLGNDVYFYLTTHHPNLMKMFEKMNATSAKLKAKGVDVVREKIELIIYDTKMKK